VEAAFLARGPFRRCDGPLPRPRFRRQPVQLPTTP